MTGKIGHIKLYPIPESIKTTLKIKEDTLFFNIPLSFCKENKIKPENLKFDILKDSKNNIWFVPIGTGQIQIRKPTPTKMEALSNVK
ncbi:MAG: hypothetical protein IIA82_09655 [Thaumarchaeota archaeon]|nr:hypothetical protein [Nitrososphaerota archaeon]